MMPEIDVQESLTRKIGPLPAWGWGLVVVGTFFVVKLFRGGGPPQQTETATIVGGEGVSTDIPSDPAFSGPGSLVQNLVTSVGALTNWQTLQTRLTTLLNQQSNAQQERSKLLAHYAYWTSAYRDAHTAAQTTGDWAAVTKAKASLDWVNGQIAKNQSVMDDQNKQIAEIQQQMGTGSTI
jgi:hypothetical protein